MIILKEKKQPLNEMARASVRGDGLPFDIYIYSNDHMPPHAHIVKRGGNDKLMFLLTDKCPVNLTDIVPYRCQIDRSDLIEICRWASKDHIGRLKGSNWNYALSLWDATHPK